MTAIRPSLDQIAELMVSRQRPTEHVPERLERYRGYDIPPSYNGHGPDERTRQNQGFGNTFAVGREVRPPLEDDQGAMIRDPEAEAMQQTRPLFEYMMQNPQTLPLGATPIDLYELQRFMADAIQDWQKAEQFATP